eukprot:gene3204-4013_t
MSSSPHHHSSPSHQPMSPVDDAEEKKFISSLFLFMANRGTPIEKIPIFDHKELNLYKLYNCVIYRGGLEAVIENKLWRQITTDLAVDPERTDAGFRLRIHYLKYLYPYERKYFLKLEDDEHFDYDAFEKHLSKSPSDKKANMSRKKKQIQQFQNNQQQHLQQQQQQQSQHLHPYQAHHGHHQSPSPNNHHHHHNSGKSTPSPNSSPNTLLSVLNNNNNNSTTTTSSTNQFNNHSSNTFNNTAANHNNYQQHHHNHFSNINDSSINSYQPINDYNSDPILSIYNPTSPTTTGNMNHILKTPVVNLKLLETKSLKKYNAIHRLKVSNSPSKKELFNAVMQHFVQQQIDEDFIISSFLKRVKSETTRIRPAERV